MAVKPAAGCERGFTLRVNVLEQCQYDCGYCRPGTARVTARADRLKPHEYERLAAQLALFGVRKVRFTGGEPLLRPDILQVIAAFRRALPDAPLAVTTNGQRLCGMLELLRDAGLTGATVHVDSLRPERYLSMMGLGNVGRVLESVARAKSLLETVKLNVVVQRGLNDDELGDFLEWSRDSGVEVRFIEMMNTGSAAGFTRKHFFSGRDIIARLGESAPVTPLPRRSLSDPAALYRRAGVTFGVIASDTEPFCGACNRLRLSPDGRLRGCLYEPHGAPLGAAMREGVSDVELASMLRLAISGKRSHHPATFAPREAFSMASVGG